MRTTATKVKQILSTELSDGIVEAFITSASTLLDEVFSDGALSAALLEQIEMWLAAHMIASTREQQLTSAKAGSAEAKFQGQTGMLLDATFYGQQAKLLDTTNRLSDLGGLKKEVSFYVVPNEYGTPLN